MVLEDMQPGGGADVIVLSEDEQNTEDNKNDEHDHVSGQDLSEDEE